MPEIRKTAREGPRGPGKRSEAHAKPLWAERSGRGHGGAEPRKHPGGIPRPPAGALPTRRRVPKGAAAAQCRGAARMPPRSPGGRAGSPPAGGRHAAGSAQPEGTHSREWAGTLKRNGHPAKSYRLAFVRGLEPKGGKPPFTNPAFPGFRLLCIACSGFSGLRFFRLLLLSGWFLLFVAYETLS